MKKSSPRNLVSSIISKLLLVSTFFAIGANASCQFEIDTYQVNFDKNTVSMKIDASSGCYGSYFLDIDYDISENGEKGENFIFIIDEDKQTSFSNYLKFTPGEMFHIEIWSAERNERFAIEPFIIEEEPPSAPTGLTVSKGVCNPPTDSDYECSIQAEFNSVSGTDYYKYKWTNNNSAWTSGVKSTTSTTTHLINVFFGDSYSFQVQACNDAGCSEWVSDTGYVDTPNEKPVASFTFSPSNNLQTGDTVYFDASNSYDPDGESLTYSWDFGDGSTSSSANPSHGFVNTGSSEKCYVINLIVTDDDGDSDISSKELCVEPMSRDFDLSVDLSNNNKYYTDSDSDIKVLRTKTLRVSSEISGDLSEDDVEFTYYLDGDEMATEDDDLSFLPENLGYDGAHTLRVKAVDKEDSSNKKEVSIDFTVWSRPNILLIHGLDSDYGTWEEMAEELEKARDLSPGTYQQIETPYASFDASATSIFAMNFSDNKNLTFEEQGEEVCQVREKIYEDNNQNDFIIIAHSMGGLASIACINSYQGSETKVRKLITLGSPHLGSNDEWLSIFATNGLGQFFKGDAAGYLSSGSSQMQSLLASTKANSSKYSDIDAYFLGFYAPGLALTNIAHIEGGDGVVDIRSQLGIGMNGSDYIDYATGAKKILFVENDAVSDIYDGLINDSLLSLNTHSIDALMAFDNESYSFTSPYHIKETSQPEVIDYVKSIISSSYSTAAQNSFEQYDSFVETVNNLTSVGVKDSDNKEVFRAKVSSSNVKAAKSENNKGLLFSFVDTVAQTIANIQYGVTSEDAKAAKDYISNRNRSAGSRSPDARSTDKDNSIFVTNNGIEGMTLTLDLSDYSCNPFTGCTGPKSIMSYDLDSGEIEKVTETSSDSVDIPIPTEENAEYFVIEDSYQEDTSSIDRSKYWPILEGWNLLGSPNKAMVHTTDYGWYPTAPGGIELQDYLQDFCDNVYTFEDGSWSPKGYYCNEDEDKYGQRINKRSGFWLKSKERIDISFTTSFYNSKQDFSTATSGWNLLSSPSGSLHSDDFPSSTELTWVYRDKEWIKNPSKVLQGEGFWIKIK